MKILMKLENKLKKVNTTLSRKYFELKMYLLMWNYYLHYKHVERDCDILDTESMEGWFGEEITNYIIEDLLEECYSDPRRYGYPLDREGGNWHYTNSKYYLNDLLEFNLEVDDGNCVGTQIQDFYCEVY